MAELYSCSKCLTIEVVEQACMEVKGVVEEVEEEEEGKKSPSSSHYILLLRVT